MTKKLNIITIEQYDNLVNSLQVFTCERCNKKYPILNKFKFHPDFNNFYEINCCRECNKKALFEFSKRLTISICRHKEKKEANK